MSSAKLPPAQADVLVHLFNALPCVEEANTFDFSLTGDFAGRLYAAELSLMTTSGLEGCSVVGTLATHTPHAFLAITTSLALETAQVLANLEEFQYSGGELGDGHSVSFPEWSENLSGYTSVILAKPSVFPGFERLGESADLDGRHVRFWLALPCTANDMNVRRNLDPESFVRYRMTNGASISFG